ncbi:hypothetical protein [Mechercharimyces sp. CAU 1602]|uniref:hypothetical protein n=1 Tax=Mechercharimyces sp. CAU 1602 TaxID=2973933 RepID=UPI00216137F5|nr:hypothetical protein [Mechercharimyces sp. CAU 1602]MCS1351811.1 hypothetical protein [Mechercharimyces sp. CAU 1602]
MKQTIVVILLLTISFLGYGCGSVENDTAKETGKEVEERREGNEAGMDEGDSGLGAEVEKGSQEAFSYDLKEQKYKQGDISIVYPEIINPAAPHSLLEGEELIDKLDKVNLLIKDEALQIIQFYSYLDEDVKIDVRYQASFASGNSLSILYTGVAYVKGAAYPTNLLYSSNIDLVVDRKVRLADYITVNDAFIKALKSGAGLKGDPAVLDEYDEEELKRLLQSADMIENEEGSVYSYLTQNRLGLSFPVNHARGDHMEVEVNYSDIREFVNKEHGFKYAILGY